MTPPRTGFGTVKLSDFKDGKKVITRTREEYSGDLSKDAKQNQKETAPTTSCDISTAGYGDDTIIL